MPNQIQLFFPLFTGFIGIIITFVMLFSYKSNKIVNGYLALACFIASIRSISSVVKMNENSFFSKIDFSAMYALALIGIPSIFLYLKSLTIDQKKYTVKNLLHSVFPILVYLYLVFYEHSNNLNIEKNITIVKFGVILFILYYFINILIIYYRNFYFDKQKQLIYQKHHQTLKKWTNFIFIIILLVFIRLLMVLGYEVITDKSFSGHTNSLIQSFLLFSVVLTIILNPEILFGYPKLIGQNVDIETNLNINNHVWKTIVSEITNVQEAKLKEKITQKTNSYICTIDSYVDRNYPFRDSNFSITELSLALKIPSSHLAYIFKYHCKLSFVEYKNYSKINDSIQLIENSFLDTKTFDALAYKVGFKSYNSFFVSFKKYANYTPKDYLFSKNN